MESESYQLSKLGLRLSRDVKNEETIQGEKRIQADA
jgi:hypothetical protein